MYHVDLNCDMGEGYGKYTIGNDEEIMKYITSANIACGFHAGDPAIMRRTVQLAAEHDVGIGAHPGLPDLSGFGRRMMDISPKEAYDMVVYQIGALQGFVQAEGVTLQHVKPHGALFNMAAKQRELADAIAQAIKDVDSNLILFGLAGSELVHAGKNAGLNTASEVFSDRTYQEDGSLTSRRDPDALITDHEQAVSQVIRMIKEKKVMTLQEKDIDIDAQTVCIHGDGEHAVDFASYITQALNQSNIELRKIADFSSK
ncbi:LamB/YcsF family protein [Halobacillus yeomjeoni]|uniref:5-oxoprolinase subunit A n=1 Tax=Halobacillus yeomjeoni TaxID=311194 RepID=A0A931MWE1_9BACI|nr:5-oxoprolinase subunit PxpA [Halobacillus yeomjeoni]MBH0231241.1 LamB/YcsF family protein [Halobacillus yeomjeoni]MCA0984154.1 LamB/YcsF family protein [Halobacillus yeomjeoni]